MHVRYPLFLRRADAPGSTTFALLFALESSARAILSTVITLQALTLLGDARDVSLVFSMIGGVAFVASFSIPLLVRVLTRRWAYTLGATLLIGASILLATLTVQGQIAGMLMRVFGAATLSITTSLYIMQYIAKRDLTKSEPRRMQFSALAWTLGPWLGVFIYESLGPTYVYSISATASLVLLGYFWYVRLSDNPAIQKATKPPPNPIKSIGRFLAQPRLRLAWMIVFGRSSWWVFFFIYTPVYLVQSGFDKQIGALAVSAGNLLLFLSPVFGRLATRFSLRRVIMLAFVGTGMATFAAGLLYDWPAVAVSCLFAGALGCVAMDALGNIPFIRAVHPHERPQMTTVFRTYSDASELLPPALFALILTYADLRWVFLVFGVITMAHAFWPRFLPKRM